MAKATEKQKMLAIGGGALGICLLAGGGVFWAGGLIDEVQVDIDAKNKEIAAAEVKIAKIPTLENQVIILRENLGDYVKILPAEQEVTDFVKVLQVFATQCGIETTELKPGRAANTNSKVPEKFSRIEYEHAMTANLWQFLKYVNLIENYERFVSITDFSLTPMNARDGAELRDGERVYAMKLKMETYKYNSIGAGQDVEIPNYAQRREELSQEILKNIQQLRIEKYEHLGQRGRRDIFIDPRQKEGVQEGPPLEVQRETLERLIGEVQKLRELNVRLRRSDLTIFDQYSIEKALKDGIEKLDAEVADTQAKQLIAAQTLRTRLVREVIDPLAELGNTKDKVRQVEDPYLAVGDFEQLISTMSTLLAEGDFEGADSRFQSVGPRVLVPEDDPRYPLAVTAKSLHVKVKTAMEFRTLELKIQGVLVNHDGGRSGLILNGEVLEEGEYVNDQLMVRRVEEEQVWFVFKGLTLIRTL